MNAREVLSRYAAGQSNFKGVSLRGQSLKSQDLSGADFSEADIQGTDFTDANLKSVNFSHAKAGRKGWGTVFLIVVVLFLSALSGAAAGIMGTISSENLFSGIRGILTSESLFTETRVIYSLIIFTVLIVLFIVSISQGLTVALLYMAGTGAGILVVLGAVFASLFGSEGVTFIVGAAWSAAGAGIWSLTGVLAQSVAGVVFEYTFETRVKALFVLFKSLTYVVWGSSLTAVLIIFKGAFTNALALPITVAEAGSVAILGGCIGKLALAGNEKHAFIRRISINLAATGGTSFFGADLTDADFSHAILNSTDLRANSLIRTRWYQAKKLDCVRSEATYFQNAKLRQLVITCKGQNENFDRLDLRGVNLQGANLENASFIDTDLSQANLQEANLFEAKLVQTNLDQTNLSNAHLTGAYIEDWGITRRTRLDGVKCKYVYLKLPTKGDRDPNRMPPSEQGNFSENDLYIFITSVLDTLDLYHRQNINASVAVTVLKGLTKNYPVQFELVGLEKRGNDQFVIRLKVFGQASHFKLQREYYARYEQTLPLYDPKRLMSDTDVIVAKMMKKVEENPGTHIENLHNQGIFIAEGEVDMSRNIEIKKGDYYEQSGNFGIGHMSGGEIKDNATVAAEINEAEKQNLADAATEIQQLLEQLSETYPTTTSREKNIVVGEAVDQIENNPTLKAKVINALKAGGTEAFKEAVNHPLVNILVATIEGWQDAE